MKLTSKQLADQAIMSLEKYRDSGNVEHLDDAKRLVQQAQVAEAINRKILQIAKRKVD